MLVQSLVPQADDGKGGNLTPAYEHKGWCYNTLTTILEQDLKFGSSPGGQKTAVSFLSASFRMEHPHPAHVHPGELRQSPCSQARAHLTVPAEVTHLSKREKDLMLTCDRVKSYFEERSSASKSCSKTTFSFLSASSLGQVQPRPLLINHTDN